MQQSSIPSTNSVPKTENENKQPLNNPNNPQNQNIPINPVEKPIAVASQQNHSISTEKSNTSTPTHSSHETKNPQPEHQPSVNPKQEPSPPQQIEKQQQQTSTTDEVKDFQVQIASSIIAEIKRKNLPYTSTLFKQTALIMSNSLDTECPCTLDEAIEEAHESLEKGTEEFLNTIDTTKLLKILGPERIKQIRLIELQKLHDHPYHKETTQDPASVPPKKKTRSHSGLYLNGFSKRNSLS